MHMDSLFVQHGPMGHIQPTLTNIGGVYGILLLLYFNLQKNSKHNKAHELRTDNIWNNGARHQYTIMCMLHELWVKLQGWNENGTKVMVEDQAEAPEAI
jgi:hypothetical protein